MMVDQESTLAIAFIRNHPAAAARTLERHDLAQVAEFISSLPRSCAAQLVPRLLPQYLGRLCGYLETSSIVELLAEQELSFVAAVMRYLAPEVRDRVLAGLSPKRRTACNLLLSFTDDTVGAWQTPLVATVPDDCQVSEALHHIRVAGELLHSDYVFIVDRERFLRARVRNVELLRAVPDLPIMEIAETGLHALPGRLSLYRAAEHPDWAGVDVMPVINRRQQFIGIIRHVDLRKGLEQLSAGALGSQAREPISGLLEVYGDAMLALFNSFGDTFDSGTRK